MNQKLKCFVAMRIGKKDTNKMYKDQLRPAMTELDIEARHVDDEEHNEDIDDRIIKLLKRRDFIIADLTYARPSVYFEAGYAQGYDKPVIYTCRRDHSEPFFDKEYGELKVHFDVLMKNIIWWTDSRDKTFGSRLKKRVNYVIRPLLLQRAVLEKEKQSSNEFAQLPLNEKVNLLQGECKKAGQLAGYRGTTTEYSNMHRWLHLTAQDFRAERSFSDVVHRIDFLRPGWIGARQRAGFLEEAYIVLVDGFTKADMIELRERLLKQPVCDLAPIINSTIRKRELREQIIVCNLGRTDLTKFASLLPKYTFALDGKRAFVNTTLEIPPRPRKQFSQIFVEGGYTESFVGRKRGKKYPGLHKIEEPFVLNGFPLSTSVKRSITISTVDNIKSAEDFRLRLRRILKAI